MTPRRASRATPASRRVLERLLWLHAVRADEPLVLAVGARRWRLWPEDLREVERAVRGRGLPWNASRAALAGALASALVRQQDEAGISTSDRAVERLSRSPAVRAHVDRLVATAHPGQAGRRPAATGRCSPGRRTACCRSRSRTPWPPASRAAGRAPTCRCSTRRPGCSTGSRATPTWSSTRRRTSRRCSCARSAGAAPPAARRCSATSPRAPPPARRGTGREVLRHLGKPSGRLDVLTTGYRVPREVLDLANRLLPTIAPGVAPADSLRSVPGSLEVRRTARLADAAVDGGRRARRRRVDRRGGGRRGAAAAGGRRPGGPGRARRSCSDRPASPARSRSCRQRW